MSTVIGGLVWCNLTTGFTYAEAVDFVKKVSEMPPFEEQWRIPTKHELQIVAGKPDNEKTIFTGVIYWCDSQSREDHQAEGVAVSNGTSKLFGYASEKINLVLVRA